ncbi:MAG: response regulator [Deltaproteobacteria bacterium]|nr:response regulator [Deltaproteobacteria bacterium]
MSPVTSSWLLLVEDNANDELLTLHAFKRAAFANPIVVARDGVEALGHLHGELHATPPLLVLLDLKLPRLDGLEVLRRIRAHPRTAFLPVVILTTSTEQRDMVEGYALRANGYVRKPVDFAEFTDAVAKIGAYWLMINEPPPQVT